MSGYFTRGHLMRSAERGCGNKYILLDLNAQTFYPTNIAPEAYMYAANAEGETHWTQVESLLPSEWRCSDTLFVAQRKIQVDLQFFAGLRGTKQAEQPLG